MALTKKGSRSIVVDGVSYRWLVRRKPTYDQFVLRSRLLLAAERADVRRQYAGDHAAAVPPEFHRPDRRRSGCALRRWRVLFVPHSKPAGSPTRRAAVLN